MSLPAWYVDEITGIAERLRTREPTNPLLNLAAGEIDHLGRKLYGFGDDGAREVAACFTAAREALIDARGGEEPARAEAAARAVGHLEAAARHAGAEPRSESPP